MSMVVGTGFFRAWAARPRGYACNASGSSLETSNQTSQQTWFDWKRTWYPLAIEKELDKRVPHGVTILGYDLVVWWDKSGQSWQVFEDKCPHRLAPLSEGRISENGHLQCSYHGWSFGPNGGCSGIPQASKASQALYTKGACVTTYGTKEQQGILWFYPDKDPSEAETPPAFPVLEDPSFVYYWATSDLPYGYEALIENLMDPTHVPFAHHKLQGNRKNAKPVKFSVRNFDRAGFKGSTDKGNVQFKPPCSFTMEIKLPSKNKDGTNKTIYTVFMCVPTIPGRSKVFWAFPRNFAHWANFLTPMWVAHLRHMLVLDSDLYLLHLVEKKQKVDNQCYTPTSADVFVMAFRRWLDMYAGGAPSYSKPWLNVLPPSPPKKQLMDRYQNHVKNCPTCKNALLAFKVAEVAMQVGSVILIAGLAASKQFTATLRIQLALVAVLMWAASRWTSYFVKKNYHFHDYNHALVK